MPLKLRSPSDTLDEIRDRFKQRRLTMHLTREGLAKRSGVTVWSLKRFENTGLIAFDSLLKIAFVLDCLTDFDKIASDDVQALSTRSLDDVLADGRTRKKGRIK